MELVNGPTNKRIFGLPISTSDQLETRPTYHVRADSGLKKFSKILNLKAVFDQLFEERGLEF